MYELIVLSLLMRSEVHGYVISTVINDVIGPFARASNGRIYPLLDELRKQGFIEVGDEHRSDGGRTSRAFRVTESGRARFRELMLDTSSSPRDYRERFSFKVTAFDLVSREDRVRILEHYVGFSQAHVRHLEEQARDIASTSTYGHSREHKVRFAGVFHHLTRTWAGEAAWATSLLAEETASASKRATPRPRRPARPRGGRSTGRP